MMNYRNAPNYTRVLYRPDGTELQTFIHCGKCMAIITGVTCEHCAQSANRKAARLAALRHLSKP